MKNSFSITANKTIADLNELYFSPAGRTLAENEIMKLEHFVTAQKQVD